MLDNINSELQQLAQEYIEQVVDIIYDDYVDALCANEEMLRYAAYSYDNDAQYYGVA